MQIWYILKKLQMYIHRLKVTQYKPNRPTVCSMTDKYIHYEGKIF